MLLPQKLGYSDLVGLVNLDDNSMRWLSKTKKAQIESETKRFVSHRLLSFFLLFFHPH